MRGHERAGLLRAMLGTKPDSRLFRALFQYLPLRDSPNENPHVELALQPGELVLVHGPMDEDRFYWGETLDGRAGLVPSNFVERVPDLELVALASAEENNEPGNHRLSSLHCAALPSTSTASVSAGTIQQQHRHRPGSPSFALAVPTHLAQINHDFSEPEPGPRPGVPDSVCPYPPVDISRVTVQELRTVDNPRVPCPRDLQVEKRLSRSVLLSWLPPDICCGGGGGQLSAVNQYQVCVNGQVRAVIPGSFKCRALLEDLDLVEFVNVSVRAVGPDGTVSPDAACTLAIGGEAPVAPQHVRVNQVTPVSALLSWHPSSSNAEHVILLNALKVGVCPPTVFQVQLNGLSPSTIYRVSVRTKQPRAVLEKRPVERCVDFKTLPKIGLPDPPSDVQVEPGPQPGTLLVSWRPISSQPRPPSRAAVHSYLVFADGRGIAQVPSSSADHVLLRLADFADDPPLFITVRTRTREGVLSADSNVVRVPRKAGGKERELPSLRRAVLPALAGQPALLNNGLPPAMTAKGNSSSLPPPSVAGEQPSCSSLLLMPALHQRTQEISQQYPRENGLGTSGSRWDGWPLKVTTAQQQPYFTFHPQALHKEYPHTEERPNLLEMEQSYLLRHQHRNSQQNNQQIGRINGTVDRRSFPPAQPQHQPGTRATVLPGHQTSLPGMATRHVPPQLAHLMLPGGETSRSEPDLRPIRRRQSRDESDSRWFVAIQDHQGGGLDGLVVRRHQLVKVWGDMDGDGCYWGELRNRFGRVPAGKLLEIAKDDLFLAAEQRRPEGGAATGNNSNAGHTAGGGQQTMEPIALRRMRWGSLKSRSYEHAESGLHRHKALTMDNNARWQEPPAAAMWGERTRERDKDRERAHNSGGSRPSDRRMSSGLEAGGRPTAADGGTTGYKLPSLDGAGRGWRGDEDQQQDEEEEQQMGRDGIDQQQQKMGEEEGEEGDTGHGQQQQPGLRRLASQLMVAKYDYDSRQLSPNVDAEQVELSFRQGDLITVYPPMDDDGFYLGELNGVRGLVPSNFLEPCATEELAMPTAARPKGVAFRDMTAMANHTGGGGTIFQRRQPPQPTGAVGGGRPPANARVGATGAAGMTSKAFKVPSIAPGPAASSSSGARALTKKSSDLSSRTLQQQQIAARKGSQVPRTQQQSAAMTKRKG